MDWKNEEILVRLYQGEVATVRASIFNTIGSLVSGLSLQRSDTNSIAWLAINLEEALVIPAVGDQVMLTIDGNRAPGEYMEDIGIIGLSGRVPVLRVRAIILPPPPNVEEVAERERQMEIVANWRFEEFDLTSIDSLDQIQVFIEGQLRGLANIQAVGPFYAAIISIQGDDADIGKPLEFRVWHGNALTYYEGIALSGLIQFDNERKIGSLDDPELIIVKDAITVGTEPIDALNELELKSFPNPFSQSTMISFQMEEPGEAILQIFDMMGKRIYESKRFYSPGLQIERFDAPPSLEGGIYFIHVHTHALRSTLPMIFIR